MDSPFNYLRYISELRVHILSELYIFFCYYIVCGGNVNAYCIMVVLHKTFKYPIFPLTHFKLTCK